MLKCGFPAIIVFTLWILFLNGPVQGQEVSKYSPKRVSASDFIIFAWGGMPLEKTDSGPWGDFANPDEMMKDLYQCGFNASGFIRAPNVRTALENRLAPILDTGMINGRDPAITPEKAEQTLRKAMEQIPRKEDRKAVFSVYIIDEPNASYFSGLKVWSDAIRRYDENILPYINLFPDYASPEQLGNKDYREHLDQFVQTCTPPFISYDNYSLFEGGVLEEGRFYGNLEQIREKSLDSNIPFWNVVLANMHFHYAEPSDSTLRLQVYSTLAYGGRGIGYFTFYAPLIGNYRFSPVDQFGYRTKTWEFMRNTNLQIHSLAPVYCTLKSVNVFHTETVPREGRGQDSSVHLASISPGSWVVGEFLDPNDRPYVMVVNKDMKSSAHLTLQFKKEGQIKMVGPYNQGLISLGGEQHWISPGAGVLLTVE